MAKRIKLILDEMLSLLRITNEWNQEVIQVIMPRFQSHLTEAEFNTLFDHYNPIYQAHIELIDILDQVDQGYTQTGAISDLIVDIIPFFQPYVEMYSKYESTMLLAKEVKSRLPQIDSFFLDQDGNKTNVGSLDAAWVLNVAKVQRFSLLFDELTKSLPVDSHEHELVSRVLDELKKMTQHFSDIIMNYNKLYHNMD